MELLTLLGKMFDTLTTLKVPAAGADVTFMGADVTFMAATLTLGVAPADVEVKIERLLLLTRLPCKAAALEELLLLLLFSLAEDGAGDDSWDGGGGCCWLGSWDATAKGLSGLKMVELAEVAGTQEIFSLMAATKREASLGISMFKTVVFLEAGC